MPYIPPPPEPPPLIWEGRSSNDPHSDLFVREFMANMKVASQVLDRWMGAAVDYTPPVVANHVYPLGDLGKSSPRIDARAKGMIEKKVQLIARETFDTYAAAPQQPSVAIELIKGSSTVLAALVSGLFAALFAARQQGNKNDRNPLFPGSTVVAVLTKERGKVYAPIALSSESGPDFGEAASQLILSNREAGWLWVPQDQFRPFQRTQRVQDPFRVIWIRAVG
jgi:hypothetical protein